MIPFSFLSGAGYRVSPATLAPAHACSAVRADTTRTRPSAFLESTAATKCSLTNLLGAQTFTHCCCPLVETFDFFIGRKNIPSVVRKHSLALDRVCLEHPKYGMVVSDPFDEADPATSCGWRAIP